MKLFFVEPWWLVGVVVVGLLLVGGWRLRLPFTYVPSRPVNRWTSAFRAYAPLLFTGLALMGLVIALAGPRLQLQTQGWRLPSTWVLWDVSSSTREKDLGEERRKFALQLWEKALDTLMTYQVKTEIGLILFGENAAGLLKKTTDLETFRLILNHALSFGLGQSTNLAGALETALAQSEPGEALLIVSDGAHNWPDSPLIPALAAQAAQKGVVVHAVMIGENPASTYAPLLLLVTSATGGIFQKNAFSVQPLLVPDRIEKALFLEQPLLVFSVACLYLMFASLAVGWFNVLSA